MNRHSYYICLFLMCILSSSYAFAQKMPVQKQERKVWKKAEKIRKQLMNGAEFTKLAQKHSDDPGSAATGGDLGFASIGQFVSAYENAALQLMSGEISHPLKTKFGYHIIQLMEKQEDRYHTRHILIKD